MAQNSQISIRNLHDLILKKEFVFEAIIITVKLYEYQ